MPMGIGGSPYWSPGQTNYTGGYDWGDTGLGRQMLEQNQDVAYYRYGRELGIDDDNSGFSRWFAQQFPAWAKGYGAYSISDPLQANIPDYNAGLGNYGDWLNRYQAQDARLRGEDPSSRGAGPSRWIPR